MDKYEYRRQRLIELRDTYCDGKISVLAEKLQRSHSYVSRMLYPLDKNNSKRIGDDMLDLLSATFNVTKSWLSGDGDSTILSTMKKDTDTTVLYLYEVSASCGYGTINPDFPDLLRTLEIPNAALLELLGTNNLNGIQLMPPDGDSMEPTIPRKSITLIQTKVSEFQNSGVYLITFAGYTYIKRLSLGKYGVLNVTSDNPLYAHNNFEITEAEADQLTIHGKLWKVLPLEFLDI